MKGRVLVKIENDEKETDLIPYETGPDMSVEQSQPENDNDRLLSELLTIRTKYNETFFELQKLKDQEAAIKKNFESASKQATELKDKVIALDQELSNSKKGLEAAQKMIVSLQDKNVGLSDSNDSYKADLNVLRKENRALHAQIAQIEKCGSDDAEEYEVEKLLDHKTVTELHFLVRWKNYDADHDSWVSKSNLSCTKILKTYMRQNGIK